MDLENLLIEVRKAKLNFNEASEDIEIIRSKVVSLLTTLETTLKNKINGFTIPIKVYGKEVNHKNEPLYRLIWESGSAEYRLRLGVFTVNAYQKKIN